MAGIDTWNAFSGKCDFGFGFAMSKSPSGPYTTRQFSSTGSAGTPPVERWRFDHGHLTLAVAVLPDGRVAIGGVAVTGGGGFTIRLLSQDGNLLWSSSAINIRVTSLAIDSEGSILAGGWHQFGDVGAIAKFDPADGTTFWLEETPGNIVGIAVDADGNIWGTGGPGPGGGEDNLVQYSPSGSLLFSHQLESGDVNGHSIATFGDHVFVGTQDEFGGTSEIRKFAIADGSHVATFSVPSMGFLRCLFVDGDGILVGGSSGDVRLLDSAGDLVWSFGTDGDARAFARGDGGVFLGISDTDAPKHFRLTTAGVEEWSANHQSVFGLAVNDRLHVTGTRVG